MKQSLLWSFCSFTLIFTVDAITVNHKSDYLKRQSFSNILYQLPTDGNAAEGIAASGYTQISAVFTASAPNVLITVEQQDTSVPIFYDDFSVTSASNSTNALVNPGFETGSLAPWFLVNPSPLRNGIRVSSGADLAPPVLAAHTGTYALVDNADGIDGVEQLIATTTGEAYTLSFWNLVDSAIPTGVIQVSFTNIFPPGGIQLTAATHTGPSISDGISNSLVPIVFGLGAAPGVQVNVYLNGVLFGSNITQDDNSFIMNLPGLASGVYSVTASQLIGNFAETVQSSPFILTYTSPVSVSASVSGTVSSAIISSAVAGSSTAVLSAVSVPSSVASASLSSGVSASAVASASLAGQSNGLLLPGVTSSSSIWQPTGGINGTNSNSTVVTGSVTSHFTSTIYATTTYTITSCAATVTDCPDRLGSVTTEVIASTTICPCAATPTSYTTSTYCDLTTYTITSCPATVTDCSDKIGSVTVETSTYTTVVPLTIPYAPVISLTTTINGTTTPSSFQTSVPVKSPTTSAPSLFTGAAARQGVNGAMAVAAGFVAALL